MTECGFVLFRKSFRLERPVYVDAFDGDRGLGKLEAAATQEDNVYIAYIYITIQA